MIVKSSDVPHLNREADPKAVAETMRAQKDAFDTATKVKTSACAIDGCDEARAEDSDWCQPHTTRLGRHRDG